ncbi:MAG: PIN domain-containing protein [Burkholderiaceae bacterium]
MRYLLDVNVWVALFDDAHVHNSLALAFMRKPKIKIATCPIIENGVIRVMNMPAYSKFGAVGFETVRNKLRDVCQSLDHEFWADHLSLRDDKLIDWPRVLGHNQITDAYLLALAVAHKACLVTLDHRVALSTVHGAAGDNLKRL